MKLIQFILIFFALIIAGVTSAKNSTNPTGIYSNFEYIPEAGDILGIEIFVIYSREGYWVLFQQAEGAPGTPCLVKAEINGDSIHFVVPSRIGYSGAFNGHFTKDELVGSFETIPNVQQGREIRLRKGNSYWQNKRMIFP